ncbi:MAG: hypothetical protein AAB676_18005 [Verrucomicrobiota bacterium]
MTGFYRRTLRKVGMCFLLVLICAPRLTSRLHAQDRLNPSSKPVLALTGGFKAVVRISVETVKDGVLEPAPEHNKTVTICVHSNRCRFEISKSGFSVSAGCDGRDFYCLTDLSASRNATANISGGLYPIDEPWYLRLAWYAYASSPYFNKRQQMHVIAPWGNPRVDLNSHPFSAAVKYSETFPFLPREIEFVVREKPSAALFAELKMVTNGKELTVREKEFEQIKQDYVPGFVGGHYTVLAWTNFNGHCVPMQAELKRFLPNIGLWEVYHCTTEAISSSSETDYLPGLTRPTMVADSRLRSVRKNINSVTYMITNGTWLTASDPRLKPFIAAAMKEGIFLRKPESEQYRPAFVIAIVLLLLTPVFMYLAKRHVGKRNNATTKG